MQSWIRNLNLRRDCLTKKHKKLKNSLEMIAQYMSELKISNCIPKDFLDKHSDLNKRIAELTEQNKVYLEET